MWVKKDEKKKKTVFDDDYYTFLGKSAAFKGKATFDGTVRIDGHFDGEIVNNGGTLILGEHAVVKGVVTGDVIVSGGKIEGNLVATKEVQLLKPAVLIGDVHAPSFSMEDGVLFQGMCDMGVSQLDDLEISSATEIENVHDLHAHRDNKARSQEA